MDCLCCADGGTGPSSNTEFLGSVCRLRTSDGHEVKFPAQAGRYLLYVIAGCPFAARPWAVLCFYGLQDAIRVVRCFPAADEDGWFFEATSAGEKQLVDGFPDAQYDPIEPTHGFHHLSQLYYHAKPDFQGAISVPLLWDAQTDTAVSNSSLGLSEMIATQLRSLGTRNTDVLLFPSRIETPGLYAEHAELVKLIHNQITTAVYKINNTSDGRLHDDLVDAYYFSLDGFQKRIKDNGGSFLMGNKLWFADLVLFISLIRLDLAYQWRFGLGKRNIRENYPGLLNYMKAVLAVDGIKDSVLPRDIMALYFMTPKWVKSAGRTLPKVPEAWETQCMSGTCETA